MILLCSTRVQHMFLFGFRVFHLFLIRQITVMMLLCYVRAVGA